MATLYPAPTAANGLYYTISMVSDATSYTVTATAARTQVDDTACLTFTIDNLGQKTPVGNCWNK